LVFVLLVGAYAEMQTPGVGVAGGAALVALVLLLAPPMVIGLAEWWHIVALVLGEVLILVEVFILPGLGIAGLSGAALVIAGLVFMAVPTEGEGPIPLPTGEMWMQVGWSLLSVTVGLALSIVAFILLQRYSDHLPFANRLVLRSEPSGEPVPAAGTLAGGMLQWGSAATSRNLRVGDVGRAATDLRPVGRAEFEGQLLDVVSVGSWVRAGEAVRVLEIEGNRIVVEAQA
jgi:membrane-bound serine protease (ClpP class)